MTVEFEMEDLLFDKYKWNYVEVDIFTHFYKKNLTNTWLGI